LVDINWFTENAAAVNGADVSGVKSASLSSVSRRSLCSAGSLLRRIVVHFSCVRHRVAC